MVALARSGDRRPPRFAAGQARDLAAALTALADQLDRPGPLST
ncbi:hypothetical protein [Jiangella endophytica]|nr:hypothetical protein [Jiangella endophytica]